jgi:GT2 family glycosyltransferase
MTRVNIVVLNWNQAKLTIDTINSLKKISHKNFDYQITLVDNGSKDDSLSRFKKTYALDSKISLINLDQNFGYVDGNNFGIKFGLTDNFDYTLILNNDVLVDRYFLENLIKFSKANSQYAILGPKIYFAPGHEFHLSRYHKSELGHVIWSVGGKIDWLNVIGSNLGVDEVDRGQYDSPIFDLDFISGCCLLVKNQVFSKIGLFDSSYFLYLEDADFCQRAIRANFKIAYVPTSCIWHINAGSSQSGGNLHHYFLSRNRLVFGFRYASSKTKFALFRQSISILFNPPSSWHRRGVIDYFFNKLNRGSWH